MTRLVLFSMLLACGSSAPPVDPHRRFPGAAIDQVVSTGTESWLLLSHPRPGAWPGPVVCRIDPTYEARCSLVPATSAHLLEAGPASMPVLAIPSATGTDYVAPFTWKVVRRVVGVAFDRPGAILFDGSLWIAEPDDLVELSPGRPAIRRLGGRGARSPHVSPRGVVWVEGQGGDAKVMTAELTSGRGLDRPTARADLRPWLLPKICHTGDHVGIIEEGTGDLVVLGISGISGAPARRIPIGFDAQLRCQHSWITARRAATTEPGTLAAWCSTRLLSRSDPCDRAGQGPFGLSDPPARSTELGSFELDPSGGLVVRGADGRSQPITIFTSDG